MMRWWFSLLFVPIVAGVINDFVHGIYYVPSFIGLNPLSTHGQSDLYSSFMTPIHERDLPLMGKIGNYVRLTGSATRYLTNDFLDLCLQNNLKVILTWSFMEYDIRTLGLLDLKRQIKLDFEEFVLAHKDHPAVAIWSFGDVFDPIFSQDDQSAFPPNDEFTASVIDLIQDLYNTLNKYAHGPVCASMFANVLDVSAVEVAANTMDTLGNRIPALDCWILGFTAEELLSTDRNTTGFGLTPKFLNAVNSGRTRQVLAQITTSAYDAAQFRRVIGHQDRLLAEAIRLFRNPNPPGAFMINVSGIIVQEWSDQWWRGDTMVGCDSGRQQPYFQSRCLRGFQGLTQQYDQLGSHCIRLRPAVLTFGRARGRDWNFIRSSAFFNATDYAHSPGSLGGDFNGLSPEQNYCVMAFPTVFGLKQGLAMGWAAVLLALCAIATVLSLYWRSHNYRSKKIGREHMQNLNNFLDWDELGIKMAKKEEGSKAQASPDPVQLTTLPIPMNIKPKWVREEEEEKKREGDEEKHERKNQTPSDTGYFLRLQSHKPLPGTRVAPPDPSKPGPPVDHVAAMNGFLTLYLREQLARQKYNVDRMIQHEATVLQVLADHCLSSFPDAASIRRTAVANVHARLLEGYHVWLKKRGIEDLDQECALPDKEMYRLYAQLLCFRLMVSLAEHIAHCPERLAQVFHEVINPKYEGANADPSMTVLTIDLRELQRGLDSEDDEELSIMKGTINFDDINDCGILYDFAKPLRKTWFESPGPAVVFDYMRDYDVIAYFKMWLFCLATVLSVRSGEDWIEGVLTPFCQFEAGLVIGAELIQFFYQLLFQNKAVPRDRIPGLLVSTVSSGFMLGVVPVVSDEATILFFCLGYAGARIVRILGLPMRCRNKLMWFWWKDPYPTAMPGRLQRDNNNNSPVAAEASAVNMGERRSSSFADLNGEVTESDVETTEMQAFVFWVVTFGLTLVAEVFMIVPIATRLTFEQVCYNPAMERCLYEDSVLASIFGSNICGACHVAIIMAKLLMAVTVFSDTPLVFYVSVAAWGYIKGQKRKVANVFSMDACKVDLRDNGAERANIEAVFGKWNNSQDIWKAMINDLYARDLICESDCRKLSTTGKKWEFSQLNPEPRERLSFWLQTVKAIAKSTKTARRDQLSSFFPPKTSKLKREQLFMGPDNKVSEDAHRARNFMFNSWISRRQQRVATPLYRGPTYFPKGTRFPVDPLRTPLQLESESNNAIVADDDEDKKSSVWCCGGGEKAKNRVKPETKVAYDMTSDETADRDLRSIPRLSHVITVYNESVMLSMDYLRDRNGDLTNLEHMMQLSTYRSEWNHVQERFRRAWCTDGQVDNKFDMLQAFLELPPDEETYSEMEEALVYEVRLWASMRAQTVIRTIRGALSYHDALRQRFACFQRSDGSACDLGEGANMSNFAELILAHQTYGDYPAPGSAAAIDRWLSSRKDVDQMMTRKQDYPIFLVYDFKRTPSMKDRDPTGKIDFDRYWLTRCEPYWLEDEAELARYWQEGYGENQKVPPFERATMIKTMVNGELRLVSVLPRMFPLRIGPREALTQGKAANQINALRCVSGHVIQVSDANMDGWIGEGFKLPHITRNFQDGVPSSRKVGSRTSVRYRIIGFREYIYTGPLGSVATAMASSEFTFGTLFQRVLSNPLNVRMHYGHPDFFDAFWVLNRGTLSKASPNLNLSEDVFSGYNTLLRNEKITHSDQLEWQKGREVVFTASSGFLGKITAGSVAIQRSRDMKYMQFRLDFPKKLSLYFGGIGGYVLNLLIDYSISLYTLFFTLAAYSTVTLSDIQATNSVLGAEWLIGLGLVTSLGYLTEMMLEHGWGDGLLKVMRSLPATALFYLFQNKGTAGAMIESVRTGNASYFDSGRPNAFDHYSLRTMYHFYAESHYYPALFLFSLFYFYNYFVGLTGGALPMFLVASACISWIVAPVMFCPQIGNINILKHDTVELMHFVFSVRDKVDNKSKEESLDSYWREKDKNFHKLDRKLTRLTWWFGLLIPTAVAWLIAFSVFIDYAFIFVWVWVTHAVSTIIFFYSNYTNLIRGIWYFVPLLGALLVFIFAPGPQMVCTEMLIGAILFVTALRVVHWALLLVLAFYVSCRMPRYKKPKPKSQNGGFIPLTDEQAGEQANNKKKVEKQQKELNEFYAKWVENFYFVFFDYHVHLYCGLAVGLAQVLAQLVFMLLSWVVRWVLRFYSSQQIRSAADFNLSRDCVRVG